MTVPRLKALYEYWTYCPPTHLLVRGFFKIPPKQKAAESENTGGLGDLLAELESAGFQPTRS